MNSLEASVNAPQLGASIPRRGNRFSRFFGLVFMRLSGWSYLGNLPDLPKQVIIVVPHTSNWDFLVGLGVLFGLGLRISFLAKHTLFWEPFATYLRWLGGVPTDRRAKRGSVGEAVARFDEREQFLLAIAPEGTRERAERWRTGFYHVARKAGVPIVPIAFDYGRRVVDIGAPLKPSGDIEADFRLLKSFFAGVKGKNPAQFRDESLEESK